MADRYGAAQPIADSFDGLGRMGQRIESVLPTPPPWFYKMLGMASPQVPQPPGSSTDPGQLPPEWEKANQDSIQQQMAPRRRLPGK